MFQVWKTIIVEWWLRNRGVIAIIPIGIVAAVVYVLAPDNVKTIVDHIAAIFVAIVVCLIVVIGIIELRDHYRETAKRLADRNDRR